MGALLDQIIDISSSDIAEDSAPVELPPSTVTSARTNRTGCNSRAEMFDNPLWKIDISTELRREQRAIFTSSSEITGRTSSALRRILV